MICLETVCNVGHPPCTSNCTLDFSTCLADPERQISYEVKIVTDYFGLQIMWNLIDSLNTVINSEGSYIDALVHLVFVDLVYLEKGRYYQFTVMGFVACLIMEVITCRLMKYSWKAHIQLRIIIIKQMKLCKNKTTKFEKVSFLRPIFSALSCYD